MLMFGRACLLRLRLSTGLCISSRSNKNIQQGTTRCVVAYAIDQRDVHALKGLVCRTLATPTGSPASHCEQCSALASLSLHARGCASLFISTSGAQCCQNIIIFTSCVQNVGTSRSMHLHTCESSAWWCFHLDHAFRIL